MGQEEFGELSAFVHHKIAELGTDILAGNIDAAPYRLDKRKPAHSVHTMECADSMKKCRDFRTAI